MLDRYLGLDIVQPGYYQHSRYQCPSNLFGRTKQSRTLVAQRRMAAMLEKVADESLMDRSQHPVKSQEGFQKTSLCFRSIQPVARHPELKSSKMLFDNYINNLTGATRKRLSTGRSKKSQEVNLLFHLCILCASEADQSGLSANRGQPYLPSQS